MDMKNIIKKAVLLAMAVLLLTNLSACGTAEETQPTAEATVESTAPEQTTEATEPTQESTEFVPPFVDEEKLIPETEPPVEVSMPEYELTYSGELKDVIVVEELNDQDPQGLKFTVVLTEKQEHIFTLYFNTDQGDLVTILTDPEGNRIPVAFQMAAVPEGLSEEDEMTFYMAQEAVNEIVTSLTLK